MKNIKKKKSRKTDLYFSDPEVIASIKQGIEEVKNGKVTVIKDIKNIWAYIL